METKRNESEKKIGRLSTLENRRDHSRLVRGGEDTGNILFIVERFLFFVFFWAGGEEGFGYNDFSLKAVDHSAFKIWPGETEVSVLHRDNFLHSGDRYEAGGDLTDDDVSLLPREQLSRNHAGLAGPPTQLFDQDIVKSASDDTLALDKAGTNELVSGKVDLLGWMDRGGMACDVLFQLDEDVFGGFPPTWSKKSGTCSSSGTDVIDVCRGRSVGSKGLVEGGSNKTREAARASDNEGLAGDECDDSEEEYLGEVKRQGSPAGDSVGHSHKDQMEPQGQQDVADPGPNASSRGRSSGGGEIHSGEGGGKRAVSSWGRFCSWLTPYYFTEAQLSDLTDHGADRAR